MCQPVKNYLGVIREYTREIITFGGLGLCILFYTDQQKMVNKQNETAARTVEVLSKLEVRVSNIETQGHRLEQYHATETARRHESHEKHN